MFDSLKAFFHHGKRYIPYPTKSELPSIFTGKPEILEITCKNNCNICKDICPSKAIEINPLSITLGSCIFCLECEKNCPSKKIKFTNQYKICSNTIEGLNIIEGINSEVRINPDLIRKKVFSIIGRSLKLRLVSAGSCNGCELELNASGNVNFDMGRYGIEFVASPRHADGLVITGPITENSLDAVRLTYEAIPEPKIVIMVGACAISGGIFKESTALRREIIDQLNPDLYVPGCPPHPLTFINGVLDLIKK